MFWFSSLVLILEWDLKNRNEKREDDDENGEI